jgi:hypothetical protein
MQFYDYVVCLWPSRELIALSFKSSGLKTAKNLNGLIKLRSAPLYAGKYTVSTAMQKNAQGSWPTYVVRNAGWAAEADLPYFEELFQSLKDKTLVIERDATGDEPVEATDGEAIPF